MEGRRSISPLSSRNSSDDTSPHDNSAQCLGSKTSTRQVADNAPEYSALKQQDANDPRDIKEPATSLRQSRKQRISLFGWWWEICAVLAAIGSTAAIVAVLVKVDDSPIATWPFSIQPASLVAIFSAIAKSSLLVPIAVCLGQLKWSYFEKPQSLDYMQVFDDASRGPWGATVFLWKTKGMVWLAGLGALVMVLMTMFEPFSQQAISFTAKDTQLSNETAMISWTDTFSDMQFNWGASLIADVRLNFTISMMQAMTGKPTTYQLTTCPGKECQFQNFTTLGACNKCETEGVDIDEKFGCKYYTFSNTTGSITDRQDYPEFRLFKDAVVKSNLTSYGMGCSREKQGFPPFNINIARTSNDTASLLGMGRLQDTSNNSSGLSSNAVFGNTYYKMEGEYFITTFPGSSFRFCASGYNRTRLGGNSEEFDTIGTFTCFKSPWSLGSVFELETFGQFKGNLSHCRMSMCAQEFNDVVILNNTLRYAPVIEKQLNAAENMSYGDILAEADGMQRKFLIGPKSTDKLKQMLETVLYSKDFAEFMNEVSSSGNGNGWEEVFRRITPVATDYIRSTANDNRYSAVGKVYREQSFFHVTWAWLVMPLLLVLMSIGVLITTAIYSRRKPYLFKNSILAAMRYRTDDWQHDETAGIYGFRETDLDLMQSAKGVRARLVGGENGGVRFERD